MQIIDITFSTQSVTPVFDAVQYDSARECGFNIQDDISAYDTVEAVFDLGEQTSAKCNCEVDDHLVTFIIPINVTREAGIFTGVVKFINSASSTVSHTFPFKVDVVANPSPDGNVYERAYQDMVSENTRAEANNTTMESYISAYGSLTPTQLSTLLSDLQDIWDSFDGQDMTTLANRITAIGTKADTNETSITNLQSAVQTNITNIGALQTTTADLDSRMDTAEDDIDALETLSDSAVYHD